MILYGYKDGKYAARIVWTWFWENKAVNIGVAVSSFDDDDGSGWFREVWIQLLIGRLSVAWFSHID